jgi:hypothetical protein
MEIPRNYSKIKNMGRFVNKTYDSKINIHRSNKTYRPTISYDPYLSTHVFTKVNIDALKPTDKIWIGISHVFLPTFWCLKCDIWPSHHGKIHDERIRWQNMKNAQMAK